MQLLTSQKNELYDMIEKHGLNPSQFEFENIQSTTGYTDIATKLIYKNTDFYYIFDKGRSDSQPHYCVYCPAEDKFNHQQYPGTWIGQKICFQEWLKYLGLEISIEDKWKRLEAELGKFKFNFSEDNDHFSVLEYDEVCIKIEIIKTNVKSLGYDENRLEKIEKTLDHLKDQAKILGKLDWKNLFIGTMMSYALEFALPPDNIASLFQVIKKAMGTFLLN